MKYEAKLSVLKNLRKVMLEHEGSKIKSYRDNKKSSPMEDEKAKNYNDSEVDEKLSGEEMDQHEKPQRLAEELIKDSHPHLEVEEDKKGEKAVEILGKDNMKEEDEEGIPVDKEKRKKHYLRRMGR